MSKRYTTPEKGTLDWNVPLNTNFELLDTHVEIRDVESSRSEYTPNTGRKYYATDTGRRYLGDGSSWSDAPLTIPTVESDPSDPVQGQIWYNTSADTLRVMTSSGAVDVASGGNTDGTSTDDGSGSGYYSGSTHYTSDYSDLQSAIDAASPTDRVLVDTDHTVTSNVVLKSDILLRGDGGAVRMGDNVGADMLKLSDVQNIWIDNLEVDGNKANNNSGRLIGGWGLGSIENLRITNCHIHDAGYNNMEFNIQDSGVSHKDIYIADNLVENATNGHGIVFAGKGGSGSVIFENIIVENNTFRGSGQQSLGIFSRIPGSTNPISRNVAFLGNDADRNKQLDSNDCSYAFEDEVRNSLMYGNYTNCRQRNTSGAYITKDGQNNLLLNNLIEETPNSGFGMKIYDWYEDELELYENHLMARNHIKNCDNGLAIENLNGRIQTSDNLMEGVNTQINEYGDNTTENGPYVTYNNGSSVSPAGLPDSIGTSVSYSDRDGNTIGQASWSRGSPSPDDPVQVDVSVTVPTS